MMDPSRAFKEEVPGTKYSWISCVNDEYSNHIPQSYHRDSWDFFSGTDNNSLLQCLKKSLDEIDRRPFPPYSKPFGAYTEVVVSAPFESILAVVQLREHNINKFNCLCHYMREHVPDIPCMTLSDFAAKTNEHDDDNNNNQQNNLEENNDLTQGRM